MAQKKKTIADYQAAFKSLFREMESELGAKASEVRIYAREVYPDSGNSAIVAVTERKTQRVAVCNISFSEETPTTIF